MCRIVARWIGWAGKLALCGSLALPAEAITVAALQHDLAAGDKVTIIDVRQPSVFTKGHIPGAINIPAALCPLKNLPPLGKVTVYGEGLGPRAAADLQTAVTALAGKPGITVDVLEGGYAAWQSAHGLTTIGRGMKPEEFNYISYAELKAAGPDVVVLVDLRRLTKAVLNNSPQLTDLGREFPGRRVTASALAQTQSNSGAAPLLVLIDSADGSAEATARLFKAKGLHRYAILIGGELAIARKGKPGLERSGYAPLGTSQSQNLPPRRQTGP
jgi:rhodanese-related sulfurtransferase